MRKNLTTVFSRLLLVWSLFNISPAFAEEELEYRFERLWPRLEQPWYFSEPSDVAIAPDGSVYITDTFNNHIQHFSAKGDFIRKWGSVGTDDGQFAFPQALTISPDGSIYVADTNNHRIQQFSAKGDFIRTWGSLGSENGQFNRPYGLAISANGNLYIADAFNNRIQQFSAEGVFIRTWGSLGLENGQFNFPVGLAIAPNGNLYITDTSNNRIQQFSAEGNFIRSWGSTGSENAQFLGPTGITIASDGSVYIADSGNHRIQKFTAAGLFIQKWGSEGTEDGQLFFSIGLDIAPYGLDIAPDGNIYVADTGNNRIQQFSAQGDFISIWGSSGSRNGQFAFPTSLATAPGGNLYVVDSSNNRIQQFNSEGDFIRSWGSSGSGNGQFNFPYALAIAHDGSIYVTDSGNNRIQQFSADGLFIRTWGGYGFGNGQLNSPRGLAISRDGSIYVADYGNQHIQQFSPDGAFIQAWGGYGLGNGQFNGPINLAISRDDNIYVVDSINNRIQQFNTAGGFIRTWGSIGFGEGQFISPWGLFIAPDNSIYVADSGNGRIQKFSAEGDFIRIWGSQGSGNGQFFLVQNMAIASDGSAYIVDTGNHRIQKFVPRNITNIATADPEGVTITHPYKAIILAGGGETIGGRTNHIWDGTWRVSQKAYKALSRQAFIIHHEIKFLTAGSTQFDLDNNNQFDDLEAASKESLRLAISEWAADAKDVVIFLANHGGPGKFQINNSEILTGEELNSWVSQLDESIPGTVTVIIEACNSASFFNQLSRPKRNLFASTKADQPAVISNGGLSSFSYFFWSEIGTGAYLQDAFRTARQGMSPISISGLPQDAQADTDGDQLFTLQDLENLGDYCLGNCNQTAAAAPVISPISPNTRTLNGDTTLDFNITVNHLQALNRVWALVQRPDDISIDPNRPLNFEKIQLNCNTKSLCQGRYERFDLKGEYRISFYAMDELQEVSFPEVLTISQSKGKAVIPAQYDDQLAIVYLRDVELSGKHLQAALELQGNKFVVIAFSDAPKQFSPAAQFDANSGILTIPHALAFGKDYQATFKYQGNLEFVLQSATPK